MMDTAFVVIKPNGNVEVSGIEQPVGKLHWVRGKKIGVKIPGHSYWSGRGEQSYAGAEIQIYELLERRNNGVYKCKTYSSIPVRGEDPKLLAKMIEIKELD